MLLQAAGEDATEDFEAVGHSQEAKEMMAPFLLGTIERSEADEARRSASKDATEMHFETVDKNAKDTTSSLTFLVPLLILFAAFAWKYLQGSSLLSATAA